jgi:hypothetical protein
MLAGWLNATGRDSLVCGPRRRSHRLEDQTFLGLTTMDEKSRSKFVLRIRNDGADDLELRKVYQVLSDRSAARDGYARVIDESGEDYLYPAEYFVPVTLPLAISRQLISLSNGVRQPVRRTLARA